MSADLHIRRARVADAPALTALIWASKKSVGYDDAFMAACAEALRVTPEQIINSSGFWVAQITAPVGCVHLDAQGTSGEIGAFFIAPDHKRQGIGRLLWAKVLTDARALGLTQLHLDADPDAVAFYHALGFKVVGEAASDAIPGRMLPRMQLTLPM